MCRSILAFYLFLSAEIWCNCIAAAAASPFAVSWSDQTFGFDGPWRAVTVKVGSPGQELSLYPGGSWGGSVFLESICSNSTLAPICHTSKEGGLFDGSRSATFDNESIQFGAAGAFRVGEADAVRQYGTVRYGFDYYDVGGKRIPNVSTRWITDAYRVYPGGKAYPVDLGILSLGASDINQTFTQDDDKPAIQTTFVPSYMFGTLKMLPSYSYGMHIGSVLPKIPGSLYLGGYDQNRVLGEVSAQSFSSGSFPIGLVDIEVGVVRGGSPWNYSSQHGLLAKGNASIAPGITVTMSPADPYLYLPQSTCAAIAAELPVVYQPDYGLYFWDTTDRRYSQIITSPAYLEFVFSKNSRNNANLTIKVPFSLLNLTLKAPLVEKPTSYFPCMGTTGTYALGRAFAQAAFIGVNWGLPAGNWFLAQAPGPNIPGSARPTVIRPGDATISASLSEWENSWEGHWTELPTMRGSSGSPDDGGGGLSDIAKAGIGLGVSLSLTLTALAAVVLLRYGNRCTTLRSPKPIDDDEGLVAVGLHPRDSLSAGVPQARQLGHPRTLAEFSDQPSGQVYELQGQRHGSVYELS
ncbi:uncharacterized protein BO66DRAFT_449567 [Aspergillus aculeatinus CBS 121060]|uniref:Uncharacterized protein n=1 Tax=Aspergillus aculeatinus CBS 121060 TaxID=1448322 RepID=A0ACD1HMZ2_9EURO|nr:hypothetical protein BO66DRAFT_449567 [Aspergillus aculeatinus CBS 121060]RAH74757.1 hypothetical protein BO66DRAFT_449567 [Aspergillus aculeatinus CBS 121060]